MQSDLPRTCHLPVSHCLLCAINLDSNTDHTFDSIIPASETEILNEVSFFFFSVLGKKKLPPQFLLWENMSRVFCSNGKHRAESRAVLRNPCSPQDLVVCVE